MDAWMTGWHCMGEGWMDGCVGGVPPFLFYFFGGGICSPAHKSGG